MKWYSPARPREVEDAMRGSALFDELVCWTERAPDGVISSRIGMTVNEYIGIDVVM